jgi:hypothetical protein
MTTKDMIWAFVIALIAIYLVEHNILGLGNLLAKNI